MDIPLFPQFTRFTMHPAHEYANICPISMFIETREVKPKFTVIYRRMIWRKSR